MRLIYLFCIIDSEPKRTRTICQPKGTIPYTVEDRDTIEKIALQFDSTPFELLQLNKLSSRTIFPGQVSFIYILILK